MSGDPAPRRGGAVDVTLGNLAVAASVVTMLAAAPRVLGHERFVGLGLAWTATTLFGYGLAMPTEQLISRRLNAGASSRGDSAGRYLMLAGLAGTVLAGYWAGRSAAGDAYPFMVPSVLLGIWGWTLASLVRGRVAGRGDLRAYSWLLGVEALARLVLVVLSIAVPDWASVLIGCSVGVPLLAAAVAGLVLVGRRSGSPESPGRSVAEAREQLAFVAIAVGYQVCLNGAALVLEWRVAPDAQVGLGAFVIASSYYRLASVLTGGLTTPALASLSHAWGRNDRPAFTRHLRRALGGGTLMVSAVTILAAALSPFALPLLYGTAPDIAVGVALALALSTVAATAGAIASTALMAVGHGSEGAVWWLVGAGVLVTFAALDAGIGVLTALGLVLGPALALGGLLRATRRTGRAWAGLPH